MTKAPDPRAIAENALARMQAAGFDDSQVTVTIAQQDELNIAHNEASLLRSTESYSVALVGILDGRKAAAALTDTRDDVLSQEIAGLVERVASAPQDDANIVSAGQTGSFTSGPLHSDLDLLAEKVSEILAFRAEQTGKVTIEEGSAAHRVDRTHLVTSRDTALSSSTGCLDLGVMCTATEGARSSSFNHSGGSALDLRATHAAEWFAIGDMLRETQRQIDTQPIGSRFVGDVIMAPGAVADLVSWLVQQLSAHALIAGSSVYRDRVGTAIASPSLSIANVPQAPGAAPFTVDGFIAEPLQLVDGGTLTTLLLDLYGSRKTGLPHTPSMSAWQIRPGDRSREELIGSVTRGALVNRLSMGAPAANGDFAGVIKNSFIIEDGQVGSALSDTMVSGNMAQMLLDIDGISREHIDYGGADYPWLRIPGLRFS
jgi:PmbA protein